MYPLGDRGGLCVAKHGSFNWEKPGLYFFLNVPCIHMQPFARQVIGRMLRRCTASTPVSSSFEWSNFVNRSSRSTGARQHAETLHGIDPGLFIVRVAQFRRPLGTFYQQLSSTPRHRVGKAKTQCGFPQSTRSLFNVQTFLLPVDFTDGPPLCCAYAPVSVLFYP
jgi:hypothetical protein